MTPAEAKARAFTALIEALHLGDEAAIEQAARTLRTEAASDSDAYRLAKAVGAYAHVRRAELERAARR